MNGETSLTLAAYHGSTVGAAALLQPSAGLAAANPNEPRTADQCRPIDLAVHSGSQDMLLLVLDSGAAAVPPAAVGGDTISPGTATAAAVGGALAYKEMIGAIAEYRAPMQLLSSAVAKHSSVSSRHS